MELLGFRSGFFGMVLQNMHGSVGTHENTAELQKQPLKPLFLLLSPLFCLWRLSSGWDRPRGLGQVIHVHPVHLSAEMGTRVGQMGSSDTFTLCAASAPKRQSQTLSYEVPDDNRDVRGSHSNCCHPIRSRAGQSHHLLALETLCHAQHRGHSPLPNPSSAFPQC